MNEVHAYLNNDSDVQWADEVYIKFNQWTFWGPTRIVDDEHENASGSAQNDETTRYPNVSWGFIGGTVVSLVSK